MRTWMAVFARLLPVCMGFAACENNDPTAPTGLTMTLSADPQIVMRPLGSSTGTSRITATMFSRQGTPVPHRLIVFSTVTGTLEPPEETPLFSDDNGQATSILTTSTSTAVTARSYGLTASTNVVVPPSDLDRFLLEVTPSELVTCTDMLLLTADVRTTGGVPVEGIPVIFNEVPTSTLPGFFSPTSVFSDENGRAATVWTPQVSTCAVKCVSAVCTLAFTVSDTSGMHESVPVQVPDNIP